MSKKKNEEVKEEILNNEEVETETNKEDSELLKKEEELQVLNDKYLRLLAEYDNFKKRTVKEKEAIYTDASGKVITELLIVLDNLERALGTIEDKEGSVYKGMEMILKQTQEVFEKLGVNKIESVGCEFNPELHNAVMHVEDETLGENIIAEEFLKGYTYKDKVLRYSMVKVAN